MNRRTVIALLLPGILGACMTQRLDGLKIGQRFRIDGGDGDQNFFSTPKLLRLTDAAWFPGRTIHGDALLFVVEDGGAYSGKYVALTSRVQAPLAEHLHTHGWASVIVHVITNPTSSFDGSQKDADAIGMAVVERV
jgi:hypothetical protein